MDTGHAPVSADGSGLTWTKARCSGMANCVELAGMPEGGVALRHSRDRDGRMIVCSLEEWAALLDSAKAGRLDM